jgi:sugar/nucleoside kinase (ribokinase family)
MAVAQKLQGVVAKQVFITVGEHGCAFNNGSEKWFLPAFKLNPKLYKSAVGAGDSFVAGLANYLNQNGSNIDWKECAKFAMATAAASCESYLAGGVDKERALLILAGKS